MKPRSYTEAGVDIEKGDAFANYIANMPSPAVSRDIGGFAGGVELDLVGIENPVMLSSTDGVGTKLLVAKKLGIYDSVGIDLVAMCVNDLIVAGVKPQVFLDYIACGAVDQRLLEDIIRGVVKGCEIADCTLAGGETAEMPDLYKKNDFDLAGFCSGVGDKKNLLPRLSEIGEGDVLFALPSSGIHSNGLSLARKVLERENDDVWKQLLTPTRIYVKDLIPFLEQNLVSAAAHITGGGLYGNINRILPGNLKAELGWDWPVPEIFQRIQTSGDISTEEMRKVFNMGLGLIIVVKPSNVQNLRETAQANDLELLKAGTIRRV